MQSILGVFGQSQAMKQQPDSLRARFAIEKNSVNSLHASANQESAERELQMFFPVEATMIAIKPNRTARAQKKLIVERIRNAGFKIEKLKVRKLSKEEAEKLYIEHKG